MLPASWTVVGQGCAHIRGVRDQFHQHFHVLLRFRRWGVWTAHTLGLHTGRWMRLDAGGNPVPLATIKSIPPQASP